MRPQDDARSARRPEDVRARHLRELFAEEPTERAEEGSLPTLVRIGRDHARLVGHGRPAATVEHDREHFGERRVRVPTRDEGVRPADHDEASARPHVLRERGQVFLHPVGLCVEVLEDDGVERRQVIAEEFVDREGDEGEVPFGRGRIVRRRPEDEERDDVDDILR